MARRKSRILAFQALYAWEAGGGDAADLLQFPWEDADTLARLGDEGLAFSRFMFSGTLEHIAEIDSLIKAHVSDWDFSRISKVDLAIMRLSIYALLYQRDIHPSIVIDEAVVMAKEFGKDDSYRFINAVLDNIKRAERIE